MKRSLFFASLTLMLIILSSAMAEISCDCNEKYCDCYIQYGDEGIAVEGIIDALYTAGYLDSERGNTFDDEVFEAVCRFQNDCGLEETGMMDHITLSWLIGSDEESENAETVWVPTDGGKKYHKGPNCSGMLDPRKISLQNAWILGIDDCGKCYR